MNKITKKSDLEKKTKMINDLLDTLKDNASKHFKVSKDKIIVTIKNRKRK